MRKIINTISGIFLGIMPLFGVLIFTIPIYDVLPNQTGFIIMGALGVLSIWLGYRIFRRIQIIGPIDYITGLSASPDLDNLIPKAGSNTKIRQPKEIVDSIHNKGNIFKGGTFRICGDWYGKPYNNPFEIESAEFNNQMNILTLNFSKERILEIQNPEHIFESPTFLKIVNADSIRLSWQEYDETRSAKHSYYLNYQKENKKIKTTTNVEKNKPVFDVSLGDPALMIYRG